MPEGPRPVTTAEMLAAKWPCPACGAPGPDPETGHDPCIKNLPGVEFACCGHGRQDGYVMFDDGRVLRGLFDHTPQSGRDGKPYGYWRIEPPFDLSDILTVFRALWGSPGASVIELTYRDVGP